MYTFLADLIVFIHLAYVGYVVVGQVLLLAGIARGWQWVRNPWFRFSHLAMILIVALEALGGIQCPLTEWEEKLRRLAGVTLEGDSFIGRLLHDLMFCDSIVYWHWIFKVSYIGFALVVMIAFLVAPPRFGPRPLPAEKILVPRPTAGAALLTCVGLILLYTGPAMVEYEEEVVRRAQAGAAQNRAQESDPATTGAPANPAPAPAANATKPTDLTPLLATLSGLHFLGLAVLCWAVGSKEKPSEPRP